MAQTICKKSVTQETSLYFYRTRYFDPAAGRFLSEDKLRSKSGDVNFYAYVGGDPTNAADPLGLCKVIVRYTKVWGWLPGYHAYVLTIDPSGQMMGFRGGPGENGNIATTYGPYDKYFPDYEPDVARNPEKGKCNKVLDDNKPCTRINYLLESALDTNPRPSVPVVRLAFLAPEVRHRLAQPACPERSEGRGLGTVSKTDS